MKQVASALASFAVRSRPDSIPTAVRDRARLHLLDTLGCGLAAVGSDAARHATEVALQQGGRPEASVLGEKMRVPAALAALGNGTRCHALDFDDTHEAGICHSSAVVAPAALAVGEATGASGRAVLDAYILGSEVTLRLAVALADGLYERGFHPTAVCGPFGAAAAASRLLGLDVSRATNALGVVGSFAAGLFEYLSDGSSTKPIHAGWAAQAGIQAARLAEAGGTGPASVIEGRFGLARSHTEERADVRSVAAGLGERWEVGELAIKPFPACHFVHASTWAAAELARENGLRAGDIAEIVVRIPPEGAGLVLEPLSDKHRPRTPYDAKFSLPFTVAHILVHDHLELPAFSEQSIRDEDVLALAAKITGEPLGGEGGEGASRFAGGVRILTGAGGEIDRFLTDPPGSPGNPLGENDVRTKFRANAELGLGLDATDDALAALDSIDDAPLIGEMMAGLAAVRVVANGVGR